MDAKEYLELALKTESADYEKIKLRLATIKSARLLHASIGLETEVGELQDQLKKHLFYGKELDSINILEEAGDILWYLSILLNECKFTFEDAMKKNINKLRARYGEKFSEEGANLRDLEKERIILEKDDNSLIKT